ncbi:hypothetical protein [Micromonospora chalcea]|uniref:hypothetical protein n=1 Tax=Micromonospora chalcea TaxID=1874 RepID=UPI003D707A06
MSEDILSRIQSVLDGTCAHCGEQLRPDGPSDVYCDDRCQRQAALNQARRVAEVQQRPDAARYPGDIGSMNWRPELVSQALPEDLEPVAEPCEDLAYRPSRLADPFALPLTGTVFRRAGRPAYHLRLDDGHRFVGKDLTDATLAATDGDLAAAAARTWAALERELTDARHAEPAPARSATNSPAGLVWHPPAGPSIERWQLNGQTVRAQMRYAIVRGEVHVAWPNAEWQLVGYTDGDGFRPYEPPQRPASWHSVDVRGLAYRPNQRWCVRCDRLHPVTSPGEAFRACACCGALLPPMGYAIAARQAGWRTGYDLTVRCEGEEVRGYAGSRDGVPQMFQELEGFLVAAIRRRLGLATSCPEWHAPAAGAREAEAWPRGDGHIHWAQPLSRWMAQAMRRWAGLDSNSSEREPAAEETPMQAQIRRRREQRGHTGPLPQRRRAPRRIDPGGGRF